MDPFSIFYVLVKGVTNSDSPKSIKMPNLNVCLSLSMWYPGLGDLQGHLATISHGLIVSDGRGLSEPEVHQKKELFKLNQL